MTPQKLVLFLVLLALSAYLGFFFSIAHGSTGLQPTPRDYQRLNACANASIRPSIKPENQVNEAIECAAKGKAVSRIESANGTSRAAKVLNNHYGYMSCKKGRCYGLKKFKTTEDADIAWATAYFDHYSKQTLKQLASNWTGEPWMVKSYTASLRLYVPQYREMYKAMIKK
jgi:hypothetical protein